MRRPLDRRAFHDELQRARGFLPRTPCMGQFGMGNVLSRYCKTIAAPLSECRDAAGDIQIVLEPCRISQYRK